jgi:DNA repair ATPase RecN
MKTYQKITAVLAIALALFSLSACSEQKNPEVERLQKKHEDLVEKIIERNTQINDLNHYLGTLETELDALLEDYQVNSGDQAEYSDGADRLLAIREMIADYQLQLDELNADVRRKSANLKDLENSLVAMETELNNREEEIQELVSELFDLTTELTFTREAADEALQANEELTQEMNTVYIAAGSFKELEAQGIAQKKGGIFGLGGQKMLSPDLEKDRFIAADKRQLRTIPFNCQEVEVLSIHPPESYTVNEYEDQAEIVIEDADEFWSTTNYLAVATKQ